jgi:hypothetical protein
MLVEDCCYIKIAFFIAKEIHPISNTMFIVGCRWTVVFHSKNDHVLMDRIIFRK